MNFPSADRVLGIYELLERIILHLGCPEEILQAQRVCRRWRAVIQDSSILQQACWYIPLSGDFCEQRDGQQKFKLNPVFKRLGISLQGHPWLTMQEAGDQVWPQQIKAQEHGGFNLRERIYDKPGSWTTMLATHPPCRRAQVHCKSDYPGDELISYFIESMSTYLLLGDVMAILAECQNRQEYGVDRFYETTHHSGQLRPYTDNEWATLENRGNPDDWPAVLREMPDDVSIKVAVYLHFAPFVYPAFSLRRLYPHTSDDGHAVRVDRFLHELIIHRMMIDDYGEYRWKGLDRPNRSHVCQKGKYDANLIAVRIHPEGYLREYSHTLPSLSNLQ